MVRATATLPLLRYGTDQELAWRSSRRAQQLTGTNDGTVDLALLARLMQAELVRGWR